MYKKILGLATLLITILAFGACQNTPEALPEEESLLTQNPTVEDGYLAVDTQDGMILHAWNWSMNTITDHVEAIALLEL